MVLDLHAESAGSRGYFATDSAHAEDTEEFVLRVIAELGGAAPGGGADRGVGDVDPAQGAEHEEDGYVGCGVVDCYWGARYADACGGFS